MTHDISRRELLRAAGGATLLALIPTGRRAFPFVLPAEEFHAPLLFTALPYIQPGPRSTLVPGSESVVIAWQTEPQPRAFTVEFGPTVSYGQRATVTASRRPGRTPSEARLNFAATIPRLDLGRRYRYRVREGSQVVVEGYFTTRKPRGTPIRFVAFG